MPPRGDRLRILAVTLLSWGCFTGTAPALAVTLDAYAWPHSVRQGEPLGLYVSSSTGYYHLEIIREGAEMETVFAAQNLPAPLQSVPATAYAWGCNWTRSLLLVVPDTWKSGVYSARLHCPGANRAAVFVVRENAPGSASDILLVLSTSTWQAYNSWGGKSLYDHNSTGGQRSHRVSFRRPMVDHNGMGGFDSWEQPFIKWFEGAGYSAEYATSLDLHGDPGLESHYALLLSVGHDEYWSKEMRDQVEARTDAGRNTAFLGGNTCWWQVRFEGYPDRMVCYKDASLDPYTGVDDSRVTITWRYSPVGRPENGLTGVSSAHGGYVNSHGWLPAELGYGDYTAQHTEHWVYAGTGLTDGEEFGYEAGIVGYEVDGALFQWENGLAKVTGEDGTPLNYRILAMSPASVGFGTMGIFAGPGVVFNAATTGWALGLASDPIVDRITRNVIDSLRVQTPGVVSVVDGNDPRRSLHVFAAPNPFHSLTRIAFDLSGEERVRLVIYDIGGRRVRTLADERMAPGPHVVSWPGTDDLGRAVRAGIYLYRLEAGPVLRVGKAVKLR